MSSSDEVISIADFERLRRLIYEQAGINLTLEKKTMLELRIKRRLRSLQLNSFSAYCSYLFARGDHTQELVQLIDVVTTNKTDFFREAGHFELLVKRALPDLTADRESSRPFLAWSAACSSGEEPYTLAIVLNEYGQTHPEFRFRVLGTDISTAVLETAKLAIYNQEVLRPVPRDLLRKYFLRSRNPERAVFRVVPELRQLVELRRLNFMDTDFGLTERADVIFCRNVLIYFDRPTQERVLQKLTRYLTPGGYFFAGHAETLHDMNLPLVPVAPALYRKVDARS